MRRARRPAREGRAEETELHRVSLDSAHERRSPSSRTACSTRTRRSRAARSGPGMWEPVIDLLRERGYVIRQMPCPELAFGGARRFWGVREQFDTQLYREHCRRLAKLVAAVMRAAHDRRRRRRPDRRRLEPDDGRRLHAVGAALGRAAEHRRGRLDARPRRRHLHRGAEGRARGARAAAAALDRDPALVRRTTTRTRSCARLEAVLQ